MLEILVLVLIAIQVSVFVALALVLRRLRPAQQSRRDEQWEALIDELRTLSAKVGAARAESATFLQAVFTGVQGLARNLDAERGTSQEARRTVERVQPSTAPRDAPGAQAERRDPDTAPELSPAPTLMEAGPRIGVVRRGKR